MKIYLCIILFVSSFSLVLAQDNLIELQREIQHVEKEISREKKFHQQEIEQHKGFSKQKKIKMQSILQQIKFLKEKINLTKDKNKKLIKQKKSLLNQIKKTRDHTFSILDTLQSSIQIWSKDLETGFPHNQKKHILQFKYLYDEIKGNKILVHDALDQFYQIVLDLISQGYSVENFYGTYLNQKGQIFDGIYFRAGNIFYFFISDDQNQISYLTLINKEYKWNDNPTSNIKREIIKTLNISQGKAPPELVLLPVQLKDEK